MIYLDIINTVQTLRDLADAGHLDQVSLALGLSTLEGCAERVAAIELRPVPIPLREAPSGKNVVHVTFPRPPHAKVVPLRTPDGAAS